MQIIKIKQLTRRNIKISKQCNRIELNLIIGCLNLKIVDIK